MKEVIPVAGVGKEAGPVLTSNLVGRLGTGGLISSVSMPNQFSNNVGVAIPLNGNADELLFLGEIRGV